MGPFFFVVFISFSPFSAALDQRKNYYIKTIIRLYLLDVYSTGESIKCLQKFSHFEVLFFFVFLSFLYTITVCKYLVENLHNITLLSLIDRIKYFDTVFPSFFLFLFNNPFPRLFGFCIPFFKVMLGKLDAWFTVYS